MFSPFQHLERWRFQPYADREDPFKRTYLTRDKLIWRWYCSRIEPPQFCSFWGGGKKGPFEGPQIKWNKENVCVSVGCLSKQELGGVLCWPLRARTSQSPSAKQQQTRQLTVGHKRLLLALLRGLPWKLTDSPPPRLSSSLSSCTIHGGKTTKPRRSWQAGGKAEAAITLPIRSVWNVATLYCMWTDTFVMSDTTTGRRGGFSCQQHLRSLPGNRS